MTLVEQRVRDFQRVQRERIQREIRYMPKLTGSMTFTIKFKDGVPFAAEEGVTHHTLMK